MGSGLTKVKPELKKPKLVVFDLGYAVWDYYLECTLEPPFTKDENGQLIDQKCRYVGHRKEVPEILKQLHEVDGYALAAVSATNQPEEAVKLLGLLEWDKYFAYKQISSVSKVESFKKLKATSGLEYIDMIYFSDDITTQSQIEKLGVLMIPTPGGVTMDVVNTGLKSYSIKAMQNLASSGVGGFKDSLAGATGGLKDKLGGATGGLKDKLGGATGGLKDSLTNATSGLKGNLTGATGGLKDGLTGAAGGLKDSLGGATGGLTKSLSGAAGGLKDSIGGATGGITKSLSGATGGLGAKIKSFLPSLPS